MENKAVQSAGAPENTEQSDQRAEGNDLRGQSEQMLQEQESRLQDTAGASSAQEAFDVSESNALQQKGGSSEEKPAAGTGKGEGFVEEINPFDYPGTERVRIRHLEMKHISQEDIDRVLQLTGQLEDFEILMMYYDCALAEVRTKLEVLNREVGLKKNRNPFESIKSRLKKPVSIYEKLKHRRIPFSVVNIEKYLTDVAGLRVICSFIDDIYSIRDSLAAQDDVRIIQEKDYIAHPKPNGYRSLHLILEVPIYLMQEKKYMKVELQFRTIAMDFWASVEHKMKYKREIMNAESIVEELHYSADLINQLDRRMLQIRDRIELNEEGDRVMSEWR